MTILPDFLVFCNPCHHDAYDYGHHLDGFIALFATGDHIVLHGPAPVCPDGS